MVTLILLSLRTQNNFSSKLLKSKSFKCFNIQSSIVVFEKIFLKITRLVLIYLKALVIMRSRGTRILEHTYTKSNITEKH